MKALHNLKEMLCRELEELAEKENLSMGDLDLAHKLTDTIKNIDKIVMLEEDGGYSRAGGWEARGIYGRYNDGGNSYVGRGEHYVQGHYSRDGQGGSQGGGYSGRDGYSRGGEDMMEELERLKQRATHQSEREMIQRMMDEMRSR